uniref:Cop number control protein n=1 Tax=Candidatus Phytoplasma tritici TaxID=321961 RepID=K7X3P9_9MOLU|nr:DUF2963 domain-containing protein [Candidatus Phytoplasma tritici]AFW98264.1 cop number control protein [Candidatus Phytoplasma tritici]
MQTNNQTKPKNKIFIIWGLFITGVILIFLIFLLLALKPQTNVDTQNKQTLQPNVDAKKEQETYNRLMNKIEKEINDLTNKKETFYQPDGTTISKIEIKNAGDKLIKRIVYFDDGQNIKWIKEYDPQTNLQIKNTVHNKQGKIIQIIKNKPSKDYIVEEYNPQTGIKIGETYYNSDGTVKEVKTF